MHENQFSLTKIFLKSIHYQALNNTTPFNDFDFN